MLFLYCFSCSDSPDFIVVRDGGDATAPVIAQYCNTLNGVEIISSGEDLYIEFIVDGKKQKQGFAATFEFIPENQIAPEKPHTLPSRYPGKSLCFYIYYASSSHRRTYIYASISDNIGMF